jgi:hypothetical protein
MNKKYVINNQILDWLLNSNPWTKYRTLIDFLGYPLNSKEVKLAKKQLLENSRIESLINDTSNWLSRIPTRYSDPKLSYYKLRMLSDFGLKGKDKVIQPIIEKATHHRQNSMFAVRGQLPQKLKKGETNEKIDPHADLWHIAPCNTPIITYSLLNMGVETTLVKNSVNQLKEEWKTGPGWFCHLFFVEGIFKKLKVGCPMAGIIALDVFSLYPDLKESEYAKCAYDPIRFHKEYGKSLYYFGRSKNFWTLKYPFVWYNALYLVDVLSRFKFLKKERLVKEMIDWIEKSQDKDGKYRPTSIFLEYKNWDFGNKKEASPWITFLCYRILKRWYE